MKFMINGKILLLVLSLFLLIAGCSGNNGQSNNEADETEEADDAYEETVMDDFANLTNNNASTAELLEFITAHHHKVGSEFVTEMLIALEKAQLEQSPALEDRYYTEEGVQEKLMDLYISDDFTLPEPGEIKDDTLRKLLQDAEAGGYKTESAEGSFFPVIDYERYRLFQPNVTEDMQVYIDIMAVESNVAAIKDAGLVIEWNEVVKRALSMEQFLRDFPNSPKQEDIRNLFDGYSYITFQGIDNSPLFAYDEQRKLLPEVKSAFEEAVSGGTAGSDYLGKIAEFLKVVEDHGGVQTDEVIDFQEKTTAGMME